MDAHALLLGSRGPIFGFAFGNKLSVFRISIDGLLWFIFSHRIILSCLWLYSTRRHNKSRTCGNADAAATRFGYIRRVKLTALNVGKRPSQ